jgi:hypothetical protein
MPSNPDHIAATQTSREPRNRLENIILRLGLEPPLKLIHTGDIPDKHSHPDISKSEINHPVGMGKTMDFQNLAPDFSMDDLASDAQRAMYEYWQIARGNAALPPKSTLDPVELPRRSLPSLAVMEPIDGNDFRVRIVGTGVHSAVGRDITGQRVSQIDGAESALDRLRQCRDAEAMYYASGPATWASGPQKYFTSLMLPFGSPGHIERILIVLQFTHHSPASLSRPPLETSMQQSGIEPRGAAAGCSSSRKVRRETPNAPIRILAT